jgi:hypothetical protein
MRPIEVSGLEEEHALGLLRPRPWTPEDDVVITLDLNEEPWDTTPHPDEEGRMPDALHGMYYLG